MTGSPKPKVDWLKDSRPLPHDGHAKPSYDGAKCKLVFFDVKPDDAGTYTCTVSNDFGQASTSAYLKVSPKITKPVVLEKIKDTDAYETEKAEFRVKLSSHPKADVEWHRGVTKLIDGGRYRISESDQCYTLTIRDVNLDDSGPYKMVASNEGGKIIQRAELTVKEKETAPKFEERDVGPFVVNENKDLSVSLTVTGTPKPEVSWFKDCSKVTPTRIIDMHTRGNTHYLEIIRATDDIQGSYTCEARNKLGKATKTFQIDVKGKLSLKFLYFTISFSLYN